MAFSDLLALGDRSVRSLLGGGITYVSGVGVHATVTGIFDAAYVRVDLGQAGVSSSGPAAFLLLADLPSNPETDPAATVIVAGVTYTPREVQPDGMGGVLLFLHRS